MSGASRCLAIRRLPAMVGARYGIPAATRISMAFKPWFPPGACAPFGAVGGVARYRRSPRACRDGRPNLTIGSRVTARQGNGPLRLLVRLIVHGANAGVSGAIRRYPEGHCRSRFPRQDRGDHG